VAHPVRLVTDGDVRRVRIGVALRLPLAFPHLLFAAACAGVVAALLPLQWLYLLVRGRPLRSVWRVSASISCYIVAVSAYVLLLANPWPSFRRRAYPVALAIDEPSRARRATVLLRPLLALPAIAFASVLAVVSVSAALVAWLVAVVSARIPQGLEELALYCLRFEVQTVAYAILLADIYPSLAGTSDGGLVIRASESR
jgi:hypothetical protein